MIDRQALLSDLQALLKRLEADLLERSESAEIPDVGEMLHAEYDRAKKAQRTAQNYEDWRSDAITQTAAAWVLSCVFVRFLEDNKLIDPPKIAGPNERLLQARDEHTLYFQDSERAKLTDREYLLSVFDELAKLPGTKDVFGQHNPIRELPNWLSGDAAGDLLRFFQKINANTGDLIHDFTDPPQADGTGWDTRFLGDLYQDLSEAARKKYALLQTPEFVEEFILDRTLEPALDEFGLEQQLAPPEQQHLPGMGNPDRLRSRFRMIDPACGSGHFLLGAFPRILSRWQKQEPGGKIRDLVQKTLDCIHGVDVNPYAIAIARFRLLLVAMQAGGIKRLADAPAFRFHLACGDSLLHSPLRHSATEKQRVMDWELTSGDDECEHAYQSEDLPQLKQMLRSGQYHAVVANPPYITPKDRQLNERYRKRFASCHRQYSLAVPFLERIFRLAVSGGYTGQITANSFMKREFGKKLIETFLPKIDLTHVIDTSGAYIPGHGTPTVILFGRHRSPLAGTIRALMGIRGEPSTPDDPAHGLVWSAITGQIDQPGSQSDYVSVDDSERQRFHSHPWSIGGGGAAELKGAIDEQAAHRLEQFVAAIGRTTVVGEDDAWVMNGFASRRKRVHDRSVPFCVGDAVRDWQVMELPVAIYPYLTLGGEAIPEMETDVLRQLWIVRTTLSNRSVFGKSLADMDRPWWEHLEHYRDKLRTPLSIVFAFVATHNHFVLDRGGKVFNRSAPVIKLPADAIEDDHLALLGLLNSSLACFWMKQVFYPKATSTGDISTDKGRPENNRYEFAGTGLGEFPVPFEYADDAPLLCSITQKLNSLASSLEDVHPHGVLNSWSRTEGLLLGNMFREAEIQHQEIRGRMIALQEELDWETYRHFGLCDVGADDSLLTSNVGVSETQRPFAWESDEPPASLPSCLVELYKTRRSLAKTKDLALVENSVFKRPWWGRQGVYGRLARDYEGWKSDAMEEWILDRLESYFDFDGRMNDEGKPTAQLEIGLTSVSKLADIARQDPQFMEVGEVYRDDSAFDVHRLVAELVQAESVPLLPILRYKPPGLRKRKEWEKTWDLQRREDAGEDVGTIPVPPKYKSSDFISSGGARYWALRGKLDVPKERWVSFPHCEGPDGTLVIAWAGYDHLQLARAISAYFVDVQERLGGRDDPRLIPLLAGIIELLPWLKQWHHDIDPDYNQRMDEVFEGFVTEEAKNLGLTIADIKSWEPPKKTAKRSRSRKS